MSLELCTEFFKFRLWINGKIMKTPGFYNNAHLYICLTCLILDEIQHLQNEPSKKELIPMKVWCLKCFLRRDSSDEKSAFDKL